MLTHGQIWAGIDGLAQRFDMSASALAKLAGLDPTSFNRSKRVSADAASRPRWPTTESVAKVLAATGVSFADFAALAAGEAPRQRGVPLIGFAQAGDHGFFDDAGFPVGEGWERIEAPDGLDGAYALTIAGDSMAPLYRNGDRIVVRPGADPRRGDRVVVKTLDGEVMAKEVARATVDRLELRSLNPAFPDRIVKRADLAWVARIVWASQ